MPQRFHASSDSFAFKNDAVGYRPGGAFDMLGPYAIVRNCPIAGTDRRATCYASGYPDTMYSVPANTVVNGKYIGGFFMLDGGAIEFHPHLRYRKRLGLPVIETAQNDEGKWIIVRDGLPVPEVRPNAVESTARLVAEQMDLGPVITTDYPAHSRNKGQAR